MNTMTSILQSFGSNNKQALPMSQPQPAGTKSKIHQRPQQQQHQKHEQGGLQSAAVGGLRRRLSMSSLSLLTLPISSPSPAPATAATGWGSFLRSKSLSPSMGEYAGTSIRKWWDWGWSWILSRKPTFARDLEMNQKETAALGCHSKGSWRHVFYKLGSELRRMLGSDPVGLPQTSKHDSFNYSNNFEIAAAAPNPRHPN